MLPARFAEIAAEQIVRLLQDKIAEHKILEYKQALTLATGDERAEFLADVSSFANASGGDMIFGVSEERDGEGRPTGIPADIVPLKVDNPASECARIEQLVESGVRPRIPLVQVKAVEIPDRGFVIVVRVGKSWIAPHMVTYANRSRFYSRNSSTGKVQLDVQQIGAAFDAQRGIGERLRAWKADRIAKAVSGDGPVRLHGSIILFHFIAAGALTDDALLPRSFEPTDWTNPQRYRLMSLSPETERYNADGYLVVSKFTSEHRQSYLQIFRDGSLEYGDSYALDGDEGDIRAKILEDKLRSMFATGTALTQRLESRAPIHVAVTLVGVKGRSLAYTHPSGYPSDKSEPFDRDIILSPDVMIESLAQQNLEQALLLPVVNAIWQAAGRVGTPFTHDDGAWYVPS